MVEISVERCSTDGLFSIMTVLNLLGKFQSNGRFCPNQEMKKCFRAGGDYIAQRHCDIIGLDYADFGRSGSFMDAFRALSRPIAPHVGHYQHWANFDRGQL